MASKQAPAENMLWGSRFTQGLDPLMVKYNTSLLYDKVSWSQDIRGSIAFARANLAAGILTQAEFSAIEKGFAQIAEEWRTGISVEKENDETSIP